VVPEVGRESEPLLPFMSPFKVDLILLILLDCNPGGPVMVPEEEAYIDDMRGFPFSSNLPPLSMLSSDDNGSIGNCGRFVSGCIGWFLLNREWGEPTIDAKSDSMAFKKSSADKPKPLGLELELL
jgi:hypothetical protein